MITVAAIILTVAIASLALGLAAVAASTSRANLPPFITRSDRPRDSNLSDDPEWLKAYTAFAKHEQGLRHNCGGR